MMDCEQQCRSEVAELHTFFEQWFNGAIERNNEQFDRFGSVMAPEFHIVSPDGRVLERKAILEAVEQAHGSAREAPMRIWIQKHVHRFTVGEIALVTYEEWQERDGETRSRISSALLRINADCVNGVEWLHVHETWLQRDDG